MTEKLTIEDIYELEAQSGGILAGYPMTELEKNKRIQECLAPDYLKKLAARIEARKQELAEDIAVTNDSNKQQRSSKNIDLLT